MPLRRWRAVSVFLAAMTVILCAPFLFSADMLRNASDALEYAGPFRHFAARSLQAGEWPLWNPHVFSGAPFLASPQSGLFYPANQVFWFFPLAHAMDAFLVLHLFWNALGMALLVAALGRSGAAPWLGGAAWGFGHFILTRAAAGHVIHISGYAWTGVMLAALLARRGSTLLLATSGALAAWSGHLQVAGHLAVLGALLAVFLPGDRRGRLRRGAAALVPAALAAAVQLWPTAEYLARTTRAGGVFDAAASVRIALSYSLEPAALKAFVVPGFAGHPFDGTFAGGPASVFFESYGLFLGWTAAALGAAGAVLLLRRRRWGLPAAAALFFLLALGAKGPFAPLFAGVLEGQRAPARLVFGALCAWVLMAAAASAALRRRGWGAVLAAAAAAELLFHGRPHLRAADPAPHWRPGPLQRALPSGGLYGPRLALAADAPMQNKGMLAGFANVNGFEALVPADLVAFAARTQPGGRVTTTGVDVTAPQAEAFRTLSARFALLAGEVPGWRAAGRAGPGTLWEDPSPLPEVRATGGARLLGFERPRAGRAAARWSAAAPFTAVWAERYDPGWRAWAGGRPAPVSRGPGVVQSVPAPAGGAAPVAVHWRYRPPEARGGLVLSMAAWLAAAAAGLRRLKNIYNQASSRFPLIQ